METILLLSSGRFLQKNDLSDVLGRSLKNLKIAHIITASQGKGCVSLEHLDRIRSILKDQGCLTEDIDIAEKTESELRSILEKFDGVFVNGGSTFYLLKCIRESGFDKIIKDLIPKGFIYIGASAGTCVLCPTIEMSLWKYENKYDKYGMTDFTGMNIIPFLVQVHYAEEKRELLEDKIPKASCKVRILKDEQAILLKDGKYTFIGDEEEVRL